MSSYYFRLNNYLNNGKNFYKIFFFLVVFLCVVKLPSLLTSDIQPWDEGMYATRVLSIHTFGDFIDQSEHSVGNFYSASHPPLLIWIGYFVTLIAGLNSVSLKLIIFVFSLLYILLILLIGKNLFETSVGFYAALIFCSNIIFMVFSQRFQFDIPYTFFILLSFYFVFRYNEDLKYKFLILSGISLGCCLMVKILVGFYIPMILFISYFFIRGKVNFKFRDILFLTLIGIIIALPWHIYMLQKYGSEFTDYFLKFHIIDRALHGVEMNEKNSGVFYFFSYLLSILPYSVLIFLGIVQDFKNFKTLNWKNFFFDVWFLTGLIIITILKTKLEVYILMILVPGCFLMPLYLNQLYQKNKLHTILTIVCILLNIFWSATLGIRPQLKEYFLNGNRFTEVVLIISSLLILFFAAKYIANKIELKKALYIFILIFFFGINIYYLFFLPEWVDKYKLSSIKDKIESSNKKNIIYIGTNYRFNPQFSFYFKGLNLAWKNPKFEFTLMDSKDKSQEVKKYITELADSNYFVIVEKDYINRADYTPSDLIIPTGMKPVLKNGGYELYEK